MILLVAFSWHALAPQLGWKAILEHLQKTDAVLTRLMEQVRQQARETAEQHGGRL